MPPISTDPVVPSPPLRFVFISSNLFLSAVVSVVQFGLEDVDATCLCVLPFVVPWYTSILSAAPYMLKNMFNVLLILVSAAK